MGSAKRRKKLYKQDSGMDRGKDEMEAMKLDC